MSTDDRPEPADSESQQPLPQQPDWAQHLAAHGKVPVTVVHGDPDSDEDMRLICEVLPALAEKASPRPSVKAATTPSPTSSRRRAPRLDPNTSP